MLPWLEPARGAPTPGGFAFCITSNPRSQQKEHDMIVFPLDVALLLGFWAVFGVGGVFGFLLSRAMK